MAKRRAADSDVEALSDASPASKRTRTQGNSDNEEAPAPTRERRASRKGKGKGKARRNQDSDEEEDEDDEVDEGHGPNLEDDQQFEQQWNDKVYAAIHDKGRKTGGVAEHGIIESIEMHQFMCHKYLTFTFGPQINFIIGHNGSGKSAVLSAITVVLGGKANSTGRGNGLKSFIREGQSVAEVTISIKNQGDEAYRPKDYGKSIVITRRFTKEGSSSWKIKSKDGRVISTKKEELAAICDHMNIQVDNPMNVLTQDAARQFLSASRDTDKYKFFLRGTQLSQLSDEYDICLENIKQTSAVLAKKREGIPDLKRAFEEASARFQEANKAREQRSKADALKKELAWAHVAAKEAEMRAAIEDVLKKDKRLCKYQEAVTNAEADVEKWSAEVEIREKDHQNLGDVGDLHQKKEDLQKKMTNNKKAIKELNESEKDMNLHMQRLKNQLREYDGRIAHESEKLAANTQAKRDEAHQKLEAARRDVTETDARLKSIIQKRRDLENSMAEIKKKGEGLQQDLEAKKGDIQGCDSQLDRCRKQQANNLAPYGNNIKQVINRINGMRWVGETPTGPLGMHVKLIDGRWGDLLRSQLGNMMTAFACTDAKDRPQLRKILEESGNGNASIIISERDLYDYSHGEPPEGYTTILRVLDIDDPYVLRLLINSHRIEKTFLAPSRREGDELLDSLEGGGVAFTADFYKVTKFPEGGKANNTLYRMPAKDPRQALFQDKDVGAQLRQWEEKKAEAEQAYGTLRTENERLLAEYRSMGQRSKSLENEERAGHERLRKAKSLLSSLQEEANEEMPVEIASIESAKQEALDEIEDLKKQFEDLAERKIAVNESQRPFMEEMQKVRAQIDDFVEKQKALLDLVENAAEKRLQAQADQKHNQVKLEKEQKDLQELRDKQAVVEEEFKEWTASAEKYCERIERPRKVETVDRDLKSVQAALQAREKKHGATVEEMTVEVNKAKANLENADRELRHMAQLNKALKASLTVRLTKWQEFRRHIALRCKLVFQYHLSNRGYYGKVLFDHQAGTLVLKVQTDDQQATQGRDKDPKSLSGGEKSFSTICLLLSLWESIGCPLRCLDEFDVFMDAVNRRTSMRMMIDTAKSSDKKQYVLITPQDMSSIKVDETVRVHRMTDPERGQQTLNFN